VKHSTLIGSVAACVCFGLAAPVLAAETPAAVATAQPPAAATTAQPPAAADKQAAAIKPAEACLTDLRAFDARMEKDGLWLGGSGYGYGYPLGGLGYGYDAPLGGPPVAVTPTAAGGASAAGAPVQGVSSYQDARPGYEIRILLASANILARHGLQQPCEDVLATTGEIYKVYVTEVHNGGEPMVDVPSWRQRQIAEAQPVTGKETSFRSDQVLGAEVRNLQGEDLGSVDDLVMSPKTGKVAYLVVSRGGIFGIGEKYVAVPWTDFKATPNMNLLVLDTSKAAMDAAPQVSRDAFALHGHFDAESQKVDAYWSTHLLHASTD
jgi:sporulation protein YlmC with PRC-barrel domain